MTTEAVVTPCGELAEGHGGRNATGEVENTVGRAEGVRCTGLLKHERREVGWVKAIANLMSHPVEPYVAQIPATQVGINPIGENSLVGTPELPRTGHDTTAVDINWKSKCLAVFEREGLACKLGRSVKRNRRHRGKFLTDAEWRETGNWRLKTGNIWPVGSVMNFDGK